MRRAAGCSRIAPRPTALFVANNLMLIGVMRALADAGVSVPRDMSVCSIDDFPWAPAFQPALTVVRQPIAAMASAAFRRLAERLDGDEGDAGRASVRARTGGPQVLRCTLTKDRDSGEAGAVAPGVVLRYPSKACSFRIPPQARS